VPVTVDPGSTTLSLQVVHPSLDIWTHTKKIPRKLYKIMSSEVDSRGRLVGTYSDSRGHLRVDPDSGQSASEPLAITNTSRAKTRVFGPGRHACKEVFKVER